MFLRTVILFFLTGLVVGAPLQAATKNSIVKCQAKVTNRLFSIVLDKESRELNVVTDNGYRYEGKTSFYSSPYTGSEIYFLSTGYQTGLELEIELKGLERIAFCRKSNECYLCHRQ